MNEKAITTMNEEEILAHIALQRQMREERHKEAMAVKERKAAPAVRKATRDSLDVAYNELIQAMLKPLPPPKETL